MKGVKIDVKNMSKFFQTISNERLEVFSDLSFNVQQGERLAIVGPSGCGKTTILKIMGGIENYDKGSIRYQPKPEVVPIIWQEHRLFPWLSVIKNIRFGLEISIKNEDEIKRISNKFLNMVGLKKFENFYPAQLSNGMAQRVAIARALTINSTLLLMDEPFASIDYFTKINLLNEIKSIQQNNNITVVYVTHDIRDAISWSNRIIVLSQLPAHIKEIIDLNTDIGNHKQLEDHILKIIKL